MPVVLKPTLRSAKPNGTRWCCFIGPPAMLV